MEQERDTQVIYLKDLIFTALYQWRKILIAAIVLALVFGGFQTFAVIRSNSDTQAEPDQETAQAITDLEQVLAAAETSVENHTNYMAESILMNIDPSRVYTAGADIYVSTNYQILPNMSYQNTDKSIAILRAYQTYLNDDKVLGTAADALDIPARFLSELVKFEILASNTNTMSITVIYPDAEGAQKILDTFLQNLDDATSQISQNISAHTVSLTTYQTDARTDWTLVETQNDASERLVLLNESLEAIQADLNKLLASTMQSAPTSPIVLAIVGAVLGAASVAGIAWIRHIGTDKIYSERILKTRTGIKVLGCIPSPSKQNPIDAWLKKLEGRSLCEDQAAIVSANIRNYCTGIQQLLIVGNSDAGNRECLLAALTKAGVPAADHGSLLCSTEALEVLPKYDAVLLVEQCGRSRYTDVQRALEMIEDQGKQLIGCVLLDG